MDQNALLAELFSPCLNDPVFQEMLSLVKKNSKGKIWVFGGFLYKNIAAKLYGGPLYDDDIDFVVEEKNEKLQEIKGWDIETNSYQDPNYIRKGNKMSITDLRKAIRMSGIKNPTIEAFIAETPLTIQSIAYDIKESQLIGDKGINALLTKTIAVNNLPEAEFYAKSKGKDLETVILEKASELNFMPVLPRTKPKARDKF